MSLLGDQAPVGWSLACGRLAAERGSSQPKSNRRLVWLLAAMAIILLATYIPIADSSLQYWPLGVGTVGCQHTLFDNVDAVPTPIMTIPTSSPPL